MILSARDDDAQIRGMPCGGVSICRDRHNFATTARRARGATRISLYPGAGIQQGIVAQDLSNNGVFSRLTLIGKLAQY